MLVAIEPCAYEPVGRTLKIVENEAGIVRTLFDLYLQHGSIKAVKQHADCIGLRTRPRPARSARAFARNEGDGREGNNPIDGLSDTDSVAVGQPRRNGGDVPFDRTHIHYILTNPTYAGRVRHHAKVYEGQHPAIIEPVIWDEVQEKLMASAVRGRGRSGSGS